MSFLFNGADPILKIVKASTKRKEKADTRLRFYHDQQSDDTRALIAQRWSSPEDFRIFTINMVRKIIDKRATAYRLPPKRTFEGWDQDKGEALYRAIYANIVMKRAARLTKLLRTTALQVGWSNDKPTLSVVTPNILDVEYVDPLNPSRVIVTHKAANEADTQYSDWTERGYARRDYRGHPVAMDGNKTGVNPYGVLPFIPCFDRFPDDEFFLPGGDDLIEAQQAVNVGLSNLWRSVELQAHGQAWASGISAADAIKTGPDRAITLPEGGRFGFASPDAPIEEILQAIQFVIRQTAITYDLSADVFDLESNAKSGAAKMAEQRDLQEARQDDIDLWRQYEARLFDVLKAVVNTHTPGTIPDTASVMIDFAEMKETISEGDRLENARLRYELGIWSPVDVFMAENPDFGSREDTLAEIIKRKSEAELISELR